MILVKIKKNNIVINLYSILVNEDIRRYVIHKYESRDIFY
jgi:hypothetical protein